MKLIDTFRIYCLVGVFLMVGSASAAHISIDDIRMDIVGATATAGVRLDGAPAEGFAGYIIELDIADPSIAQVAAVDYNPALQGLTNTEPLPPFTNGIICWVDINEVLEAPGGEADVLLATLTFTSLAPGSTAVRATMVMISDDNGDDMIPGLTIDTPSVTVGTSGSTDSSGGSSGSSSSGVGSGTSVSTGSQPEATATDTSTWTVTMTEVPTASPIRTTSPAASAIETGMSTPVSTKTGLSLSTILAGIAGAALCAVLLTVRRRYG
ncbi:MAG: hypothetical protein WC382_11980 [Methanoregulaceae archaeon]|jgi:hypothetical protein